VKAFAIAGQSFDKLAVTMKDLGRYKGPVLYIHGSKEPNSLRQRIEKFRREFGRGDLKVIDGADHMTTLINPQFGTSIVEFLKAHKS
jgi:pimeloyl-ACP methyl ester carboxylesterase